MITVVAPIDSFDILTTRKCFFLSTVFLGLQASTPGITTSKEGLRAAMKTGIRTGKALSVMGYYLLNLIFLGITRLFSFSIQ